MALLAVGPQQHHHNPSSDHQHQCHHCHHPVIDQSTPLPTAVKLASAVAINMEPDKVVSAPMVDGNNPVTGHIISTTIGGKNGEPKRTISYMAERFVGTGSFGVVFQAKCLETGESVAIKKVLQDRRYKKLESCC